MEMVCRTMRLAAIAATAGGMLTIAPPAFAQTNDVYDEAVSLPSRLAADMELDAARKPAEFLRFIGITKGMKVFDVNSGGGYYTELLTHIVGPGGRVVAHNVPAIADAFSRDQIAARYEKDRLPLVERVISDFSITDFGEQKYDAIIMVLAYHDVYFEAAGDNFVWPKTDPAPFLQAVYRGLKPGGVIGLVDHRYKPGVTEATAISLHRIDPAVVMRDFEAAGFVLDGEADFLANPGDDYSKNVFDPNVRRKTDRFVWKFRKRR